MDRRAALLSALALVAAAPARAGDPPTFHEDVEPILQRKCQACHNPDGIGPFPLLTYEQLKEDLPTVAEVITDRRMPPWHADPTVGAFSNDRSLTEAERSTFLAWIEHGAPQGDPTRAPAPRTFPKGWRLGEPDAVIQVPNSFTVPATGTVDYQYFRVNTDFGEDRWVKAMDVQVDAPTVVHHVLVFIKYPDGSGLKSPNMRGGLEGFFASALEGDDVYPFPAGSAKLLPKGSQLVFQVHYTPDGQARTDRPRMGLYFTKPGEQVTREAKSIAMHNVRFAIPPETKGFEVRARYTFHEDTVLYGLLPHMHLRGESFKYLLMYPDGTHRPVLNVPRYDFNWQTNYKLAEPLFIPKGARMVGIATYDNTSTNPANPDPKRMVYFGEQTNDEMMIGYMDVVTATPEERAAWEKAGHGATTPLEPAAPPREFK